MPRARRSILAIVGPGLLVAATGVGAGDLSTAGFSGIKLGYIVLWAVVVGAVLKFTLTEGLARWQIATGETILEGVARHLGRLPIIIFLIYLIPWTFFTGAALISACGVTAHALLPIFDDPADAKIVFGLAHSAVGLALVARGGFKLFEKTMAVCIGLMFATTIYTAIRIGADWPAVVQGLVIPRVPDDPNAASWTIALIGGVGGTVTILCYGYWIREQGRDQPGAIKLCRLDLAGGYIMTALFGIAMIIITTGITLEGRGAGLVIAIGDRLGNDVGNTARWIFLAGAWAAVFSSLLGVWQAIPYLFADIARQLAPDDDNQDLTKTTAYRIAMWLLARIPIFGVFFGFASIQKLYAIVGAAFIPLLAIVILCLNSRRSLLGAARNGPLATAVLLITIAFFAWNGYQQIRLRVAPPAPQTQPEPARPSN